MLENTLLRDAPWLREGSVKEGRKEGNANNPPVQRGRGIYA